MSKNFLWFFVALTLPTRSYSADDPLKKAIEIAKAGNKFQTERLKIIAENLANEQTVGVTPGAEPYKRKLIFAKNKYNKATKANLVKVKKIEKDNISKPELKYQPNHPAADERGIVKYPNVNRMIEKTDSMEAQKSYEAGIAIIDTTKSMLSKTIDILK